MQIRCKSEGHLFVMPDPDSGNLEQILRLSAFLGVFAVMALAEALVPRRGRHWTRGRRWTTNLGIAVLDSLAVRLVFPVAAIGVAAAAQTRGWGLFNTTGWPLWLEGLVAVVALDLAIYGQHVASHKLPVLWRLHRVHHADPEIDVTTGIRFHPIEILLSMAYKMAVVAALGAAPVAVFLFEVILNACAMFNHANFKIPHKLDAALRLLLVTPDMHRVHHSVIRREIDSNYGFNLSVWDRMFGTYIPQPEYGHDGMTIGLGEYPGDPPTRLGWILLLPFQRRNIRAERINLHPGDPT